MTAKTILWNGPLGYYEGGFDTATKAVAKLIAESDAFSVVGGGDTVAAIESLGLSDKFGFLSTAGGAMLEFLEKGSLPGITALERSRT
jgi:phosphoglycerate kinase